MSGEDNNINTTVWKQKLGQTKRTNFNTLYDQCNGEMPVDIFQILFNQKLRRVLFIKHCNMQKYHIMVHHSLFLKMNYKNTLMLYYFLDIIFSSAIYVLGADGLHEHLNDSSDYKQK